VNGNEDTVDVGTNEIVCINTPAVSDVLPIAIVGGGLGGTALGKYI
jgi:hypothetical protein